MGGILSGLIGGIAKGSIGGVLQEGARKQKQVEDDRNLLTRMHMQRIEDWENLSPEEQDFHVRSVEELHPELKKSGVLRTGINIAQAVTPHFANMATLEPTADPLAGVAQQAGLPTIATKRTPAQNKLLQAKLYEQNLAESERKRKVAAIQAIPEVPGGKERLIAEVETGRTIPQVPRDTFVKEGTYKDRQGMVHNVRVSSKDPSKLEDTQTGQALSSIPDDWTPMGPPRTFAPRLVKDIAGNWKWVNTQEAGQVMSQGQMTMPAGVQGAPFVPPIIKQFYTDPNTGVLVEIPEERNAAIAKGKQKLKEMSGGGSPIQPDLSAPLTPAGQKALTELLPVKAQFQGLMKELENIKDENTPLTYLGDRGLYAIGRATDVAALISNLELAKITGAMPYAKASRNFQYFRQIQQHLGNVKTDSPKLLYSKLKNAMRNFDEIEKDIRAVDVKGAKPTAGLGAPPSPSAAPSSTVRKYNPATGKLE